MQRHFDQELRQLKEKLLAMAGHAQDAVTNAVKALVERDDDLARLVKQQDSILDQFEIDVDDVAAAKRARARFPQARLFAMRVGHPAAYRLGGRFWGIH